MRGGDTWHVCGFLWSPQMPGSISFTKRNSLFCSHFRPWSGGHVIVRALVEVSSVSPGETVGPKEPF